MAYVLICLTLGICTCTLLCHRTVYIQNAIITEINSLINLQTVAIKVGPWGGSGGNAFDVTEPPKRLESVTFQAGSIVNSFGFTYVDIAGQKHTIGPFDRSNAKPTTVSEL